MSTPMDPFGGAGVRDPNRLLQELSQRVAALEAQVRQKNGVPVTQASSAFFLPNGSASTPSGGVYLFASGGDFFWRSSSGDTYSGVPQMTQGVAVSDPPNFTSSSSADPVYNSQVQNMLTNLRADAAGTKIALDGVISSLRGGDIIDT